ncbi:hypothetical protein RM530_15660 [Algiphilus sp. W345]|uniref:Uncharacterized protein n=1 Tax=Banduia mediterranea TaxID=3075609 RepID=A0ABU2WLM5_9GAMM|nr:hypothetical protein [Algiphilus sp. W345]MDT0498786.1 hypothetical protein [Algiphilus sp. W345]
MSSSSGHTQNRFHACLVGTSRGTRKPDSGSLEHLLHRVASLRWLVIQIESHLDTLWRNDLEHLVEDCAQAVGKRATLADRKLIFDGFYRVKSFRVEG